MVCMELKYKRILLKLSGESLAGTKGIGIDFSEVLRICEGIKKCADLGVEIGIVVGGGNFWRGRSNTNIDNITSDHIGMLATTMNALAIRDALEQLGCVSRVQTAIEMRQFAELYIRNRAIRHLEKGRVVIFGCGTGNPYFSTDTAAALRAAEINADIVIKATNVDGIYTDNPKNNIDAKKLDNITYLDILNKNLHVMDSTAVTLCMENKIPILVLNINETENIIAALYGEKIGTLVK